MKSPIVITLACIACAGFASPAAADSCRINERVAKIVAEEYGKKPSQVSLRDKFAVDGPNTIEDVEIHLGIEAEFKIKIPDATWAKLVSVADLDAYLRTQLKSCS
jgi:acyl carrier protein